MVTMITLMILFMMIFVGMPITVFVGFPILAMLILFWVVVIPTGRRMMPKMLISVS